jgi:hypothetical protein
MTNEFKKISSTDETRYVLESGGGMVSGGGATIAMPIGGVRKRGDSLIAQEQDHKKVKQKPRQGPLRTQTGGGKHTDKSKTIPRKEKYKQALAELKAGPGNEKVTKAVNLLARLYPGLPPEQALMAMVSQQYDLNQQQSQQIAGQQDALSALTGDIGAKEKELQNIAKQVQQGRITPAQADQMRKEVEVRYTSQDNQPTAAPAASDQSKETPSSTDAGDKPKNRQKDTDVARPASADQQDQTDAPPEDPKTPQQEPEEPAVKQADQEPAAPKEKPKKPRTTKKKAANPFAQTAQSLANPPKDLPSGEEDPESRQKRTTRIFKRSNSMVDPDVDYDRPDSGKDLSQYKGRSAADLFDPKDFARRLAGVIPSDDPLYGMLAGQRSRSAMHQENKSPVIASMVNQLAPGVTINRSTSNAPTALQLNSAQFINAVYKDKSADLSYGPAHIRMPPEEAQTIYQYVRVKYPEPGQQTDILTNILSDLNSLRTMRELVRRTQPELPFRKPLRQTSTFEGQDPYLETLFANLEEATAREKWTADSDARKTVHDKRETEMNKNHAQGKENMKGAIDRLEKHVTTKESLGPGEYYPWTVHFVDGTTTTHPADDTTLASNVKRYYEKLGKPVAHVEMNFHIGGGRSAGPEPHEPGGSGTRVNSQGDRMKDYGVREAGSPAQQAAIAINMKAHHNKPKNAKEGYTEPEVIPAKMVLRGFTVEYIPVKRTVVISKRGQELDRFVAPRGITPVGYSQLVGRRIGQIEDDLYGAENEPGAVTLSRQMPHQPMAESANPKLDAIVKNIQARIPQAAGKRPEIMQRIAQMVKQADPTIQDAMTTAQQLVQQYGQGAPAPAQTNVNDIKAQARSGNVMAQLPKTSADTPTYAQQNSTFEDKELEEGLDLINMSDLQFYKELLGVMLIPVAAFGSMAWHKAMNAIKLYRAEDIITALQKKGITVDRDTLEQIKPLLLKLEKAIDVDKDGNMAKELAKRIQQTVSLKKLKQTPTQIQGQQDVAESKKKGLYYYVNKRKKAGTSRPASSPKAPTAQAWKDAAKTAKKEGVEEGFALDASVSQTPINPLDLWKNSVRRLIADYIDNPQGLYTLAKQKGPNSAEAAAYNFIMHPKGKIALPPNEVTAEGAEYSEYSDEVDMVKNNLLTIIRACKELADTLKEGENLPEWVEEKISMSKQNMITVSEYLQSQHDQGHIYDEDHSTATGGWGQGSMNAAYKSSALAGAGHDDRAMESKNHEYFSRLQEKLDAEVDERSVSQAQAQMMAAAAHNPVFAKKVGIKTNVAKEFNRADVGKDISKLPKRVLPKKKK